MVNKNIIKVKISHINQCLERLRGKRPLAKNLFLKDKDLQDIILHNLQTAIQGCIDIASHIVSDEGWEIPSTVIGLFDVLLKNRALTKKTAETLKKMAGFRNIIVHEYEDIDLNKVYDIFKNNLPDFTAYLKEIIKFTKL